MEDIRAIDVMNYPGQAGYDRYMFKWDEYKIMCLTTFKSQLGGKVPTEEEFKEIQKRGFFAGYGSPEGLVKAMDEAGYDYVVITDVKMWSYRRHFTLIESYPLDEVNRIVQGGKGRIIGGVSYNPFRIDESIREMEKAVKEYGFKYCYMHPITFGISPNDKKLYPCYAKCMELGIPVGMQVGHSAEVLPSWVGHPYEVDEVAIDFPDLKINLSHTGYPWVDEWCSMLFRHPNVYGDISAYNPSHLEETTVKFMNGSRGRNKVLFGTNSYGLQLCKDQFLALPLKEETKRRVLHDNAVEFFGLDR